RDGISEGLLFCPECAGAAGISAHPGNGRILARTRRQHLGGPGRPDAAEGGARCDCRCMGEDYPTLRTRETEGALPGLVRMIGVAGSRGRLPATITRADVRFRVAARASSGR